MKPVHKIVGILQYALLIVVLVILVAYAVQVYKTKTSFDDLYNSLEGESSKYAKEAIEAALQSPDEEKDSEYYYRLGVIYQHNLHDTYTANQYYKIALKKLNQELKENGGPNNDYLYITDRIADNARLGGNAQLQNLASNIQHFGVGQQLINLRQNPGGYVNQDTWFAQTSKLIPSNTSNRANTIEKNKTFKSDSQNVHDSALTCFLREQYAKIKEYNASEGINFSPEGFKPSPKNSQKVNFILDTIKRNSFDTSLINGTEYDLLAQVWTRINSRDNAHNRNKLIESLEDQLAECSTGPGSTVCVAGRCSHVISSLALLDKDPTIGVLKTKEVLRNELLDGAAKIVEKYTGTNSTITPKEVIDDFIASRNTSAVQELKQTITNEINNLGKSYEGKLPDEQRNLVIQQSLAVVND